MHRARGRLVAPPADGRLLRMRGVSSPKGTSRDDGMVSQTVIRMVQRTPEYTSECRRQGGVPTFSFKYITLSLKYIVAQQNH